MNTQNIFCKHLSFPDDGNVAQAYSQSQFVGNKSRGIYQKLQSYGNKKQDWFSELKGQKQHSNVKY